MKRLVFGFAVALVAAGLLVGVARFAPAQAQAVKQAVVQVVTIVTDTILPAPPPTPTPPQVQIGANPNPPSPPVTPPTPPAPAPTSYPHIVASAAPNVPQPSPPPGVQGEAPAPQTEVFVNASPCTGVNFDVNTGGCKGLAPFTVTFSAQLQLGVAGVTPSFKWSNGMTGQTITVTYTSGVYTAPTVTVTQVVNGIPYQVSSASHRPITITVG